MQGKTVQHYKIIEELGRGGMGVVYKAEDTKLKRTVALKFLPPNILATEEEKSRFIHEAQAAASLHHPNICTIYEINEAEGQTFISMAYLDGQGLNESTGQGPMKPQDVTRIALQVSRGLQAAHENNIVHRDIKSSNILIAPDGRVTIMDFGLAKSTRQTYKTQQDTKMGTIAYMSPEQTRGEEVDHRTDIWSLGVLIYEMVTGQRPFRGDYDEAVIYSILNEEPIPISDHVSDVPEELQAIISKAMAKKPADRYQTTAELVEDLDILHEEMSYSSTSSRRSSRISAIKAGQLTDKKSFFKPRVLAVFGACIIIAAVALLYVFFSGREIGATTKTVTVQDETGQTIERTVPKNEFRKSVALYFLENKTGDSEHEWITGGASSLLEIDLYQDLFLHLRSCIDEEARQDLQEAGFTDWSEAPWNLKRKIARDANFDYLITGSYALEQDEWVITILLHESKSARLVDTNIHRGRDLFALIDEASVEIRKDLGVPDQQIETNPDLPVSEMVTSSMPAFKDLCMGIHTVLIQDWEGSVAYLERAVATDSTFAYGYFVLAQIYRAINNREKADAANLMAMQHLYKLPERLRFVMKLNYYASIGEADKVLAIGKMMVELQPNDIEAHRIMALLRQQLNELDLAIEEYKKILEIAPSRTETLQTIANLYRRMGQFDLASEYYEQYLEKHPNDADAYHAFGQSFEIQGEYSRARELYEKALIIEPQNIPVLVDVADIDGNLGEDESALKKYEQALALAKTSQDRIRTRESMTRFFTRRGQMEKAIGQIKLTWEEQEKSSAPVNAHIMKLGDIRNFVIAGREGEALDVLKRIERDLDPPLDELINIGYCDIYIELGDTSNAAHALAEMKQAIDTYKWETLRDNAWSAQGEIEEAQGNYEEAIRCYEENLKLNPTNNRMHRNIGRCYRNLGQNDKAIASLEKTIKILPNDPETNYEFAILYEDLGDRQKAMEHLRRALDWWADSDPGYAPAEKARATLADWES
jgi:serine/threonine protein kinase/tetratricopeptide (TPR) repeat protein